MNKIEVSVETTSELVWSTWKKAFNKAWQRTYDKIMNINPEEAESMKRNFDDDRKQAFEKARQELTFNQ